MINQVAEGVFVASAGILKIEDAKEADSLQRVWANQARRMPVERKDEIGRLFMHHVLRVSNDTAAEFLKGSHEAHFEVGMLQAHGAPNADLVAFWAAVSKLFPGEYTREGTEWLVTKGGADGPFAFMLRIDPPLQQKSPVIRALTINAHAYK